MNILKQLFKVHQPDMVEPKCAYNISLFFSKCPVYCKRIQQSGHPWLLAVKYILSYIISYKSNYK